MLARIASAYPPSTIPSFVSRVIGILPETDPAARTLTGAAPGSGPHPEPASERVPVVSSAAMGRQPAELLHVAASQHHVIGHHGGAQHSRDHVHVLLPFRTAQSL